MPIELKVQNTPLKLLKALELWCENKETIESYVLVHSFYGLVYTDKSCWNSKFSMIGGEIPMWRAQMRF